MKEELERIAEAHPSNSYDIRGCGMIWGLDFEKTGVAKEVSGLAFEKKMLIETAGSDGNVLKLLPPLTIEEEDLREGLKIIEEVISDSERAKGELSVGAGS